MNLVKKGMTKLDPNKFKGPPQNFTIRAVVGLPCLLFAFYAGLLVVSRPDNWLGLVFGLLSTAPLFSWLISPFLHPEDLEKLDKFLKAMIFMGIILGIIAGLINF